MALSMSSLVVMGANCGTQLSPGPWAGNSACISNNGGTSYQWHCPWESSMLVSAKKFGGCNSIKYDCTATNTATLLATYTAHSTKASPPPEGGPDFVKYTMCCINANCPTYTYVNDVTCGPAPNLMGMRLFDADMPMTKPTNVMIGCLCGSLCDGRHWDCMCGCAHAPLQPRGHTNRYHVGVSGCCLVHDC